MAKEDDAVVFKHDDDVHILDDKGNELRLMHENCMVIKNTTADPASPVTGQIWFRTDV